MSTRAERFVDRQQAALRAGVTYHTILLWERAGRLHAVRGDGAVGTELLIRVSELDHVSARSRAPIDLSTLWRPEELAERKPNRTERDHTEVEPRRD